MLIDGLWLFHRPSLRRLFEMRIYVECPKATRLRRRMERDVRLRGRTRRSVLWQFRRTVQPSHLKYVAPQSRWATIVCDGENNGRLVKIIAKLLTSRTRSA
jgi:uridine kinase